MPTQESINRKEFLMKMGFSGAALVAVLSSCLNEKATAPQVVSTLPNAPTVSASTVTGSPITVTTESAGTIIVYLGSSVISYFTAVAGANTYTPTSAGNYTFALQTSSGVSTASSVVVVTTKTSTTPATPTVSTSTVTVNNAITVTTATAGTLLVFNGTTQVASLTVAAGTTSYTPTSSGTYTFKIQTSSGISAASTAVTVSAAASTTTDLLTLDLTASANANLKTVGGYIRQSNIVVALVAANTYAAVTQICSHEGQKQIIYTNGMFYCTAHGAEFNTSGVGLNSNGRNGITVYKTSLVGNILHVYK